MALRSGETTIGDRTYTVQTLDSRKGIRVWTKICAVVAGPLGAAAAAGAEGDITAALKRLGPDGLRTIFGALADKLDSEDVHTRIIEALLNAATVRVSVAEAPGKKMPLVYELEFAANYDALIALLWFAMELNFSSFFRGRDLGAFLSKAQAILARPGTADSTSGSGASS